MSRRNHKPKRTKRYVPKHVHIPILRGLRDEFSIVLHSSIIAAENGSFNKDHYDRIGWLFNCIWGALEMRPPKDASVKLVIEGAMRTMNQVSDRGAVTGIWQLRELEQAAVLAGIQKAEEHLLKMDVFTLNRSIEQFKLMQIEDDQQAQFQIHKSRIVHKSQNVGMTEINRIQIVEMDATNNPVRVHTIVRGEEQRSAA